MKLPELENTNMFNYTTLEETKIEFSEIAPASELPNGERLFVDLGDKPIVIFNLAGQYFAIGDVCSHDDGPLGDGVISGQNIVCPRHGAEFDLRSGKAVAMPAVIDIPSYPVQVRNGVIFVGIPKE